MKGLPGKPLNSERPISTKPFHGPPEHDLTGKSFSDLFVIGYFDRKSEKHRGSQWVVRCKCGRYEVRRSQKLKKQDPLKQYFCSICEEKINKANHDAWLYRTELTG